jgi:hypothetical protein
MDHLIAEPEYMKAIHMLIDLIQTIYMRYAQDYRKQFLKKIIMFRLKHLLFILLISCQGQDKKCVDFIENKTNTKVFEKIDSCKVKDSISDVYVINPLGASIYLKPDSTSILPSKIEFIKEFGPYTLYKKNILGNWGLLYINDKWVYVKLTDFDKKENIKLRPEDLTLINHYVKQGNSDIKDYPVKIDSLFKISLVSEDYYNSLKSIQVTHIVQDTVKFRRKKGILKLPLNNRKIIELKDRQGEGSSIYRYYYHGQIPFFNSYLVGHSGYEEYDFLLIDKKTGKEKYLFLDHPFITPNKKYIVSINANPYTTTADMQIDKIENEKIENLYYFNFIGWMPWSYTTHIVWESDNAFIIKAIHPYKFWNEDGIENQKDIEYVRVEFIK